MMYKRVFSILIGLVLLFLVFPAPALACFIFTRPTPVVYGQPFEIHVTGAIPSSTYQVKTCKSGVFVLSGLVCATASLVGGILQRDRVTIGADGTITFVAQAPNAPAVPVVGGLLDPATTIELWVNNGSSAIDSCHAKINYSVAGPGGTVQDSLKQTCDYGSGFGVDTAIGCVPTDNLANFITYVLKFAFLASGGIILLMGISTGYTLVTSQGNPEKLAGAKENLVALFSGLILIVFSMVLLQAIGADVLGLPSFLP